MASADLTAVFIIVPVDDVMKTLYAPTFSIIAKDLFRVRRAEVMRRIAAPMVGGILEKREGNGVIRLLP